MDFALNEEQLAISELAGQVIGDASTNERLRELEKADGPRFDAALWASLADTGILGAFLPEEHGGAGLDLIVDASEMSSGACIAVHATFQLMSRRNSIPA